MSHAAIAPGARPAVYRTDLRRVGPVVALVVVVHALLLATPRQPAASSGAPSAVRSSVQVRMLEVPAPKPMTPATALAATAGPLRDTRALDAAAIAPAFPSEPMEVTPPPTAVAPVVPKVDALLGFAMPGMASDDDLYFPRSQLLVAPTALGPVVIDYPRFDGDAGRYAAELSLYIDETGRVARVRVDSGSLPPALEDAARRAFTQARFRPGEAAEHGAVKSRIRIEVSFDSGQPSGR
jgi:TonB family protein